MEVINWDAVRSYRRNQFSAFASTERRHVLSSNLSSSFSLTIGELEVCNRLDCRDSHLTICSFLLAMKRWNEPRKLYIQRIAISNPFNNISWPDGN